MAPAAFREAIQDLTHSLGFNWCFYSSVRSKILNDLRKRAEAWSFKQPRMNSAHNLPMISRRPSPLLSSESWQSKRRRWILWLLLVAPAKDLSQKYHLYIAEHLSLLLNQLVRHSCNVRVDWRRLSARTETYSLFQIAQWAVMPWKQLLTIKKPSPGSKQWQRE